MNNNNATKVLSFIHGVEPLKTLLRHSWLSSGRRESVAEHTWRMALMAIVIHPYLKKKPDLQKTLKIILAHDLVEIYAGDTWAFKKHDKRKKSREELKAITKISKNLPTSQRKEIVKLSRKYIESKTKEAKFAKALDKLEVLIQHNQSNIKKQNRAEIKFNLYYGDRECSYDPFLRELRDLVKEQTLKYYKRNNVDKAFYV